MEIFKFAGLFCKHALNEPIEFREFFGSIPSVILFILTDALFSSGKETNVAFANGLYKAM